LAESQLQNGSSVIIDASFMHKNQRAPFALLAQRLSVPLVILHVVCSEAEHKRRLQEREAEATSVSDGRVELLALQAAGFEAPDQSEGTLIPLSANTPPARMADTVYTRLAP
jgi:predicted kinase